jgi:hypothetical protein
LFSGDINRRQLKLDADASDTQPGALGSIMDAADMQFKGSATPQIISGTYWGLKMEAL